MSNMTQHEKSMRLAHFAGLTEYDGESVYSTPCWVNPYDGVLCDNIYNSMSFAWNVHVKAVREYPAYREWWIAHALDSEVNHHWDWLDKVYAVITKRPLMVIDGQPTFYRKAIKLLVGGSLVEEQKMRKSGRLVMCISTEGIEA